MTKGKDTMKDLPLTPSQAARVLGIPRERILGALRSGQLPHTIFLAKQVRIRQQDLLDWANRESLFGSKAVVR